MKPLAVVVCGLVLTACGTATSAPPTADPGPAERPTAVPAADGPVTTTYGALVIDDGTPHACLGVHLKVGDCIGEVDAQHQHRGHRHHPQ